MRINSTRHDQLACCIDDIRVRVWEILSNLNNRFPVDQNIRAKGFGSGNEGSVLNQSRHLKYPLFHMSHLLPLSPATPSVLQAEYPCPAGLFYKAAHSRPVPARIATESVVHRHPPQGH